MTGFAVTRTVPANYRGIILSKWLRSLRYGSDYMKLIDQDAYFAAYGAYVERVIDRPDASLLFAVLADERDVVLGFSVSERNLLHYVHVHRDVRRQGIARALIPPHVDTITNLTHQGLTLWAEKFPHWKFNPFAA